LLPKGLKTATAFAEQSLLDLRSRTNDQTTQEKGSAKTQILHTDMAMKLMVVLLALATIAGK
jgi:hypothetical protein